jgi:hypothetical protein
MPSLMRTGGSFRMPIPAALGTYPEGNSNQSRPLSEWELSTWAIGKKTGDLRRVVPPAPAARIRWYDPD